MRAGDKINCVGSFRKESQGEIGLAVRLVESAIGAVRVGYESDIGDKIQMFPTPLEGEWLKSTRRDSHLKLNCRAGCGVLSHRVSDDGRPACMITILRGNETVRIDEVVMDFALAKAGNGVDGVSSGNQLVVHCVPIQIGPRCRR